MPSQGGETEYWKQSGTSECWLASKSACPWAPRSSTQRGALPLTRSPSWAFGFPYLAHANATRAAAAFSFCLCGMCRPVSDVSSSHEHSSASIPLRQSAGSLVKLRGWQSRRQLSSTSAVMLQRVGSVRLWDWMRGKTSRSPIREVKGACSGCCNKPWRLSSAKVSSSPELSLSCCSSKASWRWAFHSPRKAFRRYSSRRA